jgi:hypothetical protein
VCVRVCVCVCVCVCMCVCVCLHWVKALHIRKTKAGQLDAVLKLKKLSILM